MGAITGPILHHIFGAQHGHWVHMGHKIGHIIGHRVCDNLARGANLHNAPALHQGNAVAQFERLIQIMADENNGALQFGLQIQQLVLQAGADQRVKGGKRLVHQQNGGLGGKGAGKADALLHPSRKFPHTAIGPWA